MPLIASNRIGVEHPRRNPGESHIRFYGSSFIADQTGGLLAEAGDSEEAVLVARFDRQEMRRRRDGWFLFRDRRPETYGAVGTLTGAVRARI
jgi:N-carbamoylputrescine amidase